MTRTWFYSDPHFGHDKACQVFKRPDGSPLRPFKDAEECDNYTIAKWNERVADEDRVYLLGDLVINHKFLYKMSLIKGRKVIVPGNHDTDLKKLPQYGELRSYVVKKAFIASHIPLHEDCIDRFNINIHGHLHYNVINDPRYISACAEQLQFVPRTLDELMGRVLINQEAFKQTGKVINWADQPFSQQ